MNSWHDNHTQLKDAVLRNKLVANNSQISESIIAKATKCVVHKDHHLIKDGDSDSDIYLVLSGAVEIFISGQSHEIRKDGDFIGELAAIKPGERRSADVKVTMNDTVLLKIGSDDLAHIGQLGHELYKSIALELGDKLRQRNKYHRKPNDKPIVFIGSSGEAKDVVNYICESMKSDAWELRPWTEKGLFEANEHTLERLVLEAQRADFGIFVLAKDDLLETRNQILAAARDNVIYELGLFTGAIGRKRTIMVVEAGVTPPSDLKGITYLQFHREGWFKKKLKFNSTDEIKKKIETLGVLHRLIGKT